MAISETKGQG